MPVRQNQARVTLTVDGVDYGVWDKKKGGQVEADDSKFSPGGMGRPISLGGRAKTENVTLSRLNTKDVVRFTPALRSRVGKGAAVVKVQFLDENDAAFEDPDVWTGTLTRVTPPEHDSESDDAAMIEVEIATDGTVA